MKQVKRAFAMLLCVATVLSLCMVYAGAGNVCEKIEGDASKTVTFTVTTSKKWGNNNLKFTQPDKGKYEKYWDSGEFEAYGRYTITYTNEDGKAKTKRFTGADAEINLRANHTYTITVSPDSYDELHRHFWTGGGYHYWVKTPEWEVAAQKNVELCQ